MFVQQSAEVGGCWIPALPFKERIQQGLLVLSVATSILSLIPSLRLQGAMATKSIATLSSTVGCIEGVAEEKQSISDRLLNITKVAIVALGLASLATASPALFVSSLVAETGLQAIEGIKAAIQGESKAFVFGTMCVLDSLVLGAVITASWPLMVTASVISGIAMTVFAGYCLVNEKSLEAACYFALAGVGFATAVATTRISASFATAANYTVKNETQDTLTLYDFFGRNVGTAAPGETISVKLSMDSISYRKGYDHSIDSQGRVNNFTFHIFESRGRHIRAVYTDIDGIEKWTSVIATSFDEHVNIYKNPLPAKDFPTLPLGGTSLRAPTSLREEKQPSIEAE